MQWNIYGETTVLIRTVLLPKVFACAFRIAWTIFFPVFNSMLLAGHVITKGKQTTFSTIPKTRHLTNPENWRPFAFLNINKNFSTRMVEKRVRPILEAQQSNDKIGFRFSRLLENCVQVYGMVGPDVVCKFEFVETALIILTTMRCLMLWRGKGVPYAYSKCIATLYHDQVGLFKHDNFRSNGVWNKKAVLSSFFFNAGLEHAIIK